jgi:hypothetical protein
MRRAIGIALFVFAAAGYGADFTGIWIGQVPVGRNGDLQDIAFKLTQTGTAVSGKLYGDYRSMPVIEGQVFGEEIVFVVAAQEQAGNQINDTRLRFTGVLKGNELEVTRERESSTNAGNGGGVQIRNNSKLTFKLKRLL